MTVVGLVWMEGAPLSKHSHKCFDVSISQICRKLGAEIQILFSTNITINILIQSLNIKIQLKCLFSIIFSWQLKENVLFQVTFHCHFFLCLYEVHRQYWSIDCKSRSFLNGSAALLPQNTKVGYHTYVYRGKTQKKQVMFVRKCHNLISNKTN